MTICVLSLIKIGASVFLAPLATQSIFFFGLCEWFGVMDISIRLDCNNVLHWS